MRTQGRKTRFQGVYALGNGRYRVRVYYRDPLSGKKRERDRIVEADSAEAALDAKRALTRALEKGDDINLSEPKPLGELATEWLAAMLRRQRSDGSPHLTPFTQVDSTILITGESGAGKERIALLVGPGQG